MKQDPEFAQPSGFDAVLPPAMAQRAEEVGVHKASLNGQGTLVLAILAGAFIALGAVFSTTVTAGASGVLPYGITRLLGGLAFCLGLILVVVAGAELFTGNNLIVLAWAGGRVSTARLLRNWTIVYVGNFIGAVATAVLMFIAGQHSFAHGTVGLNMLNIAEAKCNLGFVQAVALAMGCNALVCLAVWLCFSARSVTDKILAIIFPITAFVACGMEHSVANMYFVPVGLMVKDFAPSPFWESIGGTPSDFAVLQWDRFLIGNLLPVTIGNIIGGTLMVGLVYWFVYLRKAKTS